MVSGRKARAVSISCEMPLPLSATSIRSYASMVKRPSWSSMVVAIHTCSAKAGGSRSRFARRRVKIG